MSLLKLKHEHGENFKEEMDNIRMNKSGFKNGATENEKYIKMESTVD